MNNKLKAAIYGAGLAVAGLGSAAAAFASTTSTPVTVPTDLASAVMSFAGTQLSDPGTEVVLLIVIGVPFAFYLAHKLIGLVPKGK